MRDASAKLMRARADYKIVCLHASVVAYMHASRENEAQHFGLHLFRSIAEEGDGGGSFLNECQAITG